MTLGANAFENTRPLKVLVIGAGVGGLCLAHGLARAGLEVAVYERDSDRREGRQGFWIGIDHDGSRALHRCLPPRLFDTFVASCALPIQFFTMYTERMHEVLGLDVPPGDDAVTSEKSVNRSTLRQVLLADLDGVHFGKQCTSYESTPTGVVAHFADGTTATGDVLVGADGSSSVIRAQYLPGAGLDDTGLWGITGKIPLTDGVRALLPPRVRDGVAIFAGPRGDSCVFHVVDLPWDAQGQPKPRVDDAQAELLRRWDGLRYDTTHDYIMFGFASAASSLPGDLLDMPGAPLYDLVQSRVSRWHPTLRALLATADPATCFPLNIRTSRPLTPWPSSAVTLIGDAVHTMTPGRGVGANTALRDAAALCDALIRVRNGETTVLEAISRYEAAMRDYANLAVERSRKRMNAQDPVYKPYIGRFVLASRRTGMRLVNRLPAVKRRMAEREREFRGAYRAT
ncbi:2-polyprenyl-6-methoxyphenol hydroxylase-like FAD-dependent oxidoreductase [Nocardia tenerifensis]|uniref:2-polyprenyl-6-methoxyphenol hydroxylase-like FAD-dependent oxidoreductase n=1 Tax=Nocardia tenerifensis TaxID=228006 RepID=A0A318L0B0_9NOCA|nr:NAD(P)/FAD-dependent oxidoreductase [Nocardia tenerifensis]PXX71564.1 2-polyprenyl-6-methoxyphenol hydroxylase-like FAD-dependent oxidoreductase [Nocardia tenerifensis]